MDIHALHDGEEDAFCLYFKRDGRFIALCDGGSWDGERVGENFFANRHCKSCMDLYVADLMGPAPRMELVLHVE